MAAPAAAAAAVPGICFWLCIAGPRSMRGVDIRPLSPSFDPDTSTFADVVTWGVMYDAYDRHRAWLVGDLYLGTDVPLDTPLRDWMDMVGRRADDTTSVKITLARAHNDRVCIAYALAFGADRLPWPLWDEDELDPVLGTRIGNDGTDNMVKETSNHIHALVGLRRGRHVKVVNMYALASVMKRGNAIEPLFRTTIDNMDKFMRQLDELQQRLPANSHDQYHADNGTWSADDTERFNRAHLPIIDLATLALDGRYGRSFASFEAHVHRDAAYRSGAPDSPANYSSRGLIFDFIHENPWISLAELEVNELVRNPKSGDASDALAFARDEHARMLREIGTDSYNADNDWVPIHVFLDTYSYTPDADTPLDIIAGNSEFEIATDRTSFRDAREFRLFMVDAAAIHRSGASHAERMERLVKAARTGYKKQSYRTPNADEIAVRAAVRRRPPNRLINLLLETYKWKTDRPLPEHARVINDAILRGGHPERDIRQVRQLLASLLPIYARFTDPERMHLRNVAIRGAITASGASEAAAAATAAIADARSGRARVQLMIPMHR